MRTTVTVDDDLLRRLKQRANERGVSLKDVLNEALRTGLDHPAKTPRVKLPTYDLRARPGVNLDKALALAAELEDREIADKLARGR